MNQFIQSLVHLPQNYRRALVKAQGLTRVGRRTFPGVGWVQLILCGCSCSAACVGRVLRRCSLGQDFRRLRVGRDALGCVAVC